MPQDPHTGFIIAAYAVTALVMIVMIAAILSDYRALKSALSRFGDRGTDRE